MSTKNQLKHILYFYKLTKFIAFKNFIIVKYLTFFNQKIKKYTKKNTFRIKNFNFIKQKHYLPSNIVEIILFLQMTYNNSHIILFECASYKYNMMILYIVI